MVNKCVVNGCYNKEGQIGTPLFRFPKDVVQCQRWKRQLGFDNDHKYASMIAERCHKNLRVCSTHFENHCFSTLGKCSLKKIAIPTLKLSVDLVAIYGLPEGYNYTDMVLNNTDLHLHCDDLTTAEEVKGWVKQFGDKNCVGWCIHRKYPNVEGSGCLYKVLYKCQHSAPQHRRSIKHRKSKSTGCSAVLLVNIMGESKCDMDKNTKILIRDQHNHEIGMANINPQTTQILENLFLNGYSPTSSLFTLKLDALIKSTADFHWIITNRSRIPDIKYCYDIFTKFRKESGDNIIDYKVLELKLTKWSEESGGYTAVDFTKNILTISIVTPLMSRVISKILQFEGLLYIESNNHVDIGNHTVHLLYTETAIGALPVGYIITSSKAHNIFERALTQFCHLVKDRVCFYDSPKNIVTDNNSFKKDVLRKIWPNCNIFLSSKYVLYSVWQWLSDTKHNILNNDQQILFFNFKNIMTSKSSTDILNAYNNLLNLDTMKKYPDFYNYINFTWWPIKESWCLCYVDNCIPVDNQANRYSHCVFRVLKDIFLNKFKIYNIFELVDLTLSRLDEYYSKKIIDVIVNNSNFTKFKTFLPNNDVVCSLRILHLENNNFLIKNWDKDDYIGDIELGLCTCYVGLSGAFCKHQNAIVLSKKPASSLVCDDIMRSKLIYIVTEGSSLMSTLLTSNMEIIQTSDDDSSMENLSDGENEVTNVSSACQVSSNTIPTAVNDKNVDNVTIKLDRQIVMYKELQNVFNNILERVQHNATEEMTQACEEFCKNYKSCEDVKSLQSALQTFGKTDFPKTSNQTNTVIKRKLTSIPKPTDGSPNKMIKIKSKKDQLIVIVE